MGRYLRTRVAALAGWLLVVGLASIAHGQGVTGSAVSGNVTAEGGGAVEGADVTLKNTATGDVFTAVTGRSGEYFIDNVPPGGLFTLTVSSLGFQPAGRGGIRLALGQRLAVDVVLHLDAVEVIQIEEHIDELRDRDRSGASTTVNDAEINGLPLQGRNFTDLTSTAPQVTGGSVAGQNNRFNNIQIDGGANNDLFGLSGNGTPGGQANATALSIEAVDQFVVQVAPFDVQQGNFAGGLVNAITKSGTNEFHGSLFAYYQNKVLAGYQSDPTFTNYSTLQFGGVLGGPIITDKLHFFISADIQQRQSAFGNQFQIGGVDDAADIARAGFDNATVQKFIDILSTKYGVNNLGNALAPNLGNPDANVFAKLTTSVIENSHLELSYNFVDASQDTLTRAPTSPFVTSNLSAGYELSNSGYSQANTTNTARAKLTSNWDGGKLSNELLASVSIIRDTRELPQDLPLILVDVGTLGSSDSWLAAGGERFSQDNLLDQNIYQVQDNLTIALGDHRLTLGTSDEFLNLHNEFLQASIGVWAFASLDDLEAGTPEAFQRRFPAEPGQQGGTADFSVSQIGFYAQDAWLIGHNLTLTPGIRIDVPFLSSIAANPVLLQNTAFPIDTSKVPSGNVLWSPRLGVNWDVDGDATTVIRGGLGVFSGTPPYVWISNAYANNGLSQVQLTCTSTTGLPAFTPDPKAQPTDCAGGTGTPKPPTNEGEIDYFDPNTKYPQNFRLALGADKKLPWGLIGTADLLYTRDLNGWYIADDNLVSQGANSEGRVIYGTFAATGFRATPTRVDPNDLTQAVKVTNKDGARVYSATFQLQRQFGKSFTVSLAYTYTDSEDLMSFTSSQALSNFQFAPLDGDIQNRNLRPSAFDVPHKITLTGIASLTHGFEAGLIYVGMSGLPYTWTVNGDVNADGINGNDLVFVPAKPGDISLQDPTQWTALNNFIQSQDCLAEARGRLIQRGECRNPWQNLLNLRLAWSSPPVTGEQRFQVQLDIFDVLNLIDSNWGHFDEATGFENDGSAFLRAVGYDFVKDRPIYTFSAPTQVVNTVYSPTSSRWRIQLGARYNF